MSTGTRNSGASQKFIAERGSVGSHTSPDELETSDTGADPADVEDEDSNSEYEEEIEKDIIALPVAQAKSKPAQGTAIMNEVEDEQADEGRILPKYLSLSKIKRMKIKPDLRKEHIWTLAFDQWEKVQQLQAKLRTEKAKLKKVKSGRIEKLKQTVDREKHRKDAKSAQVNELKLEIQTLNVQLKGSNARNTENESKITQMTKESQQFLDNNQLPVTPDDQVSKILSKLFLQTRNWSEKWSKDDWKGTSNQTLANLANELLNDDHQRFASDETCEALTKRNIPPPYVLNSLLNRVLCRYTSTNIFSVSKHVKEGAYDAAAPNGLEWLVDMLKDRSPAAAHRLRASLMQAIRGVSYPSHGKPSKAIRKEMCDLLTRHETHISDTVLQESKGLLEAKDGTGAKKRQAELTSIVQAFVRTGVEFQSQYPSMQVCFRHELSKFIFELQHAHFSHHRALKLKLDDYDSYPNAEDAGVAGRKVDMVIEPAVMRSGDANGENYEAERVLLKAVVWMVKPEDLIDASVTITTERVSGPQDKVIDLSSSTVEDDESQNGTLNSPVQKDKWRSTSRKDHTNATMLENGKKATTQRAAFSSGDLSSEQSQSNEGAPNESRPETRGIPQQSRNHRKQTSQSGKQAGIDSLSRGEKRAGEVNPVPNKKQRISSGGSQTSESAIVLDRSSPDIVVIVSQSPAKIEQPESPQFKQEENQVDQRWTSPPEVMTP